MVLTELSDQFFSVVKVVPWALFTVNSTLEREN